MKCVYGIDQVDAVIAEIKKRKAKLVYVAGASASGKTYFNKALWLALEKMGHKVLNISSDDYYTDQTWLQFVLYGTFDHPNLIQYDVLQKNLDEYFSTGKTVLPKYSFIERRRVSLERIQDDYDFVLVEWLYTISQLENSYNPFTIFVDSHIEELIFRRLIRDQERTKEGIDMIVSMLGKVFPMWKLYGQTQRDMADIIIDNDFSVMDKTGALEEYVATDKKKSDFGTLYKKEYMKDFLYDDSYDGNGCIVVSEVYREKHGFLDSVIISKRKINDENKDSFHTIAIRLYQPGSLTEVHTLLQLAGLQHIGHTNWIQSTYRDGEKETILKEIRGKLFVKE
jgi:uridine kinase